MSAASIVAPNTACASRCSMKKSGATAFTNTSIASQMSHGMGSTVATALKNPVMTLNIRPPLWPPRPRLVMMRDMHCRNFLIIVLGLVALAPARAIAQPVLVPLVPLVIDNVTVIDGTGAPPATGVSVVIDGGRFVAVSKDVNAPPGAERIDGTGQFAIPGLMDMHVHLRGGRAGSSPSDGLRALHGYLYSGVTTIYDAGNNPDFIFALRAQERSGEIVAPRIFATGSVVTAPGGHGGRGAVTVEDFARDRGKDR